MPRTRVTLETFAEHVDRAGPVPPHRPEIGPCHLWTGTTQTGGYGIVTVVVDGAAIRTTAHRVAYLIRHGRWPRPEAMHRCDNPPCVRDEHLVEGTHKENADDMVAKGRARPAKKAKKPAKYQHQDDRIHKSRTYTMSPEALAHLEKVKRQSGRKASQIVCQAVLAIRLRPEDPELEATS